MIFPHVTKSPQRFLWTYLDAQGASEHDQSVLLRGSCGILLMGGRYVMGFTTPNGRLLITHQICATISSIDHAPTYVDPQSLHNPVSTDHIYQGLDLIIKYFVGTELGVANFLQRHFDWSENCLWYEQIPKARDPTRTMFFLGGKDSIIDANVSPACKHILACF